jgi:hypothetical protein
MTAEEEEEEERKQVTYNMFSNGFQGNLIKPLLSSLFCFSSFFVSVRNSRPKWL